MAEAGRGAVDVMMAADRASRELGIEVVESGAGTALVRMAVTASMVNGHRIAHGGYVFLLADTAFACACNSHGPVTVAAGADIVFVAPAREGDVLVADAVERTRFGRSGVYDVTVRRAPDGNGDLPGGDLRSGAVVAEFRGRSRTIERAGGGDGSGARGGPA